MFEKQKLSESLTRTLVESDISSVTKDVTEIALDSILEDGVLKDIPIISTIVGFGTTALSVRDYLFLKKIISFMSNVKEVSANDRREMIESIDSSDDYNIRVGEKLLYIVDKTDDHQIAGIVGILFTAFLKKKIDYDDFIRLTNIVNSLYIDDLRSFIDTDNVDYIRSDDVSDMLGSGLYKVQIESVEVEVSDMEEHGRSYVSKYDTDVSGGEMEARVSRTGRLLWETLKEKTF